jgi:hypothetical protein
MLGDHAWDPLLSLKRSVRMTENLALFRTASHDPVFLFAALWSDHGREFCDGYPVNHLVCLFACPRGHFGEEYLELREIALYK